MVTKGRTPEPVDGAPAWCRTFGVGNFPFCTRGVARNFHSFPKCCRNRSAALWLRVPGHLSRSMLPPHGARQLKPYRKTGARSTASKQNSLGFALFWCALSHVAARLVQLRWLAFGLVHLHLPLAASIQSTGVQTTEPASATDAHFRFPGARTAPRPRTH